MNWINDLLNWFSRLFQWWVIVLPWEAGIRVRLGKHSKVLSEGVYLKLPIIDKVFIQSVRLRYIGVPMQTVTTKDGKTITLTASIGYAIADINKLYNTISSPQGTIVNIVLGQISKHVASHDLEECKPAQLEEAVSEKLTTNDYGIGEATVKITGFAIVRTYRLIQDQTWFPDGETLV